MFVKSVWKRPLGGGGAEALGWVGRAHPSAETTMPCRAAAYLSDLVSA